MSQFNIEKDRIDAVFAAVEGMEKGQAWSVLILAGMIKSELSAHFKIEHSMEIKWPITGAISQVKMTLECGPSIEVEAEREIDLTQMLKPHSLTA